MASGIMTIKYGSNGIRNQANKAAGEFDSAADRLSGVAKRLDSMKEHSRHDYIRTASAFLRKKEAQYRQKQASLQAFATVVDGFMDMVKETDKRVAQHLDQSYSAFKKVTGLSMGGLILDTLKRIGQGIANVAAFAWSFITGCVYRMAVITGELLRGLGRYVLRVVDRAWTLIKSVVSVAVTVLAIVAASKALVAFAAAATAGGIIMAILAGCGVVFGAIKLLYQGMDMGAALVALLAEGVFQTEFADKIASVTASQWLASLVYNISGQSLNYNALVKTMETMEVIAYIGSALGSVASFIHSAGLMTSSGDFLKTGFQKAFTKEYWQNINPSYIWNQAKQVAVNFDPWTTPVDKAVVAVEFIVSVTNIVMPDFGKFEFNPLNLVLTIIKKAPMAGELIEAVHEKVIVGTN